LSLALLGCRKKDIWINEFAFDIDGVHYDLSTLEVTTEQGKISVGEFNVKGFRYSQDSPVDSIYYCFHGYNVNTCGDCDCAYGGQFLDRSVQKETIFNVPDPSIESYFWIRIDKGRTYDAISGYIEMINEINLDIKPLYNTDNSHKAHGTFDFIMVNRENELDTIHVTNGKFRYQCYFYSEYLQTR